MSYVVLTERPVTAPYGRTDKLLRALVNEVLDVDKLVWLSTVPDRGDSTPKFAERLRARERLIGELDAVNPDGVLLVGKAVRDCWRGDVGMPEWHGCIGKWLDRWPVMPIYHPSQVFDKPEKKLEIRVDLAGFPESIEFYHLKYFWHMQVCSACGEKLTSEDWRDHHDPDGVGYCKKHWLTFKNMWQKQRHRWRTPLDQLELPYE